MMLKTNKEIGINSKIFVCQWRRSMKVIVTSIARQLSINIYCSRRLRINSYGIHEFMLSKEYGKLIIHF